MTISLYCGDCLEVMPTLPQVNAIITDLPYGITACSWDVVIPFEPMWREVKRVLLPRGVFVTTASQPFTSKLVCSNLAWFKYEWIWDKNRGNGHLVAKYRPMQQTESVLVFADSATIYNPQMTKRDKPRKFSKSPTPTAILRKQVYSDDYTREDYTERYPTNLLKISWASREGFHPTQKPVALLEYLIRTYTNEGETVLDICAGSGTTGVACVNTGRNFIGIELRPDYYAIMERRIAEAQQQPRLEAF